MPGDHQQRWTGVYSRLAVPSILFLYTTILFLSLAGQTNAVPKFFMGRYGHQLRRDFVFDQMLKSQGIRWEKYAANSEVCADDPKKPLTIGYFNQTLDHFGDGSKSNVANNGVWRQHYQINDMYFENKTNEPVIFLQIGGEGPIDTKWVCFENYTYMQAAKKHKAKVIQLEHRFFGANKDLKDLSYESLQYLTTEQALADINKFIGDFNEQNKWTNPKWVAFGGSYPGTMAALLRKVYPNITQGNVASSAPLYATVDFWEYAYVMENTIRNTSQECYNAVQKAFARLMTEIYTPEGRVNINRAFNPAPELSKDSPKKEDIDTVTSNVFAAFQGAIQYTYDGARHEYEDLDGDEQITIRHVCNIMTDTKIPDDFDRLNKVYQLVNGKDSNGNYLPFVGSYADSIADLKNISLDGSAADMRGWMWLSCNEFGWLQSTSNNGIFGDSTPLSLYIRMCSDLFDQKMNASQIEDRIADTLDKYGRPKNFNVTNVFLPNGAFDPWSSLGVPEDPNNKDRENQHMVVRLTPEAAHCSDMYAEYKGEPKGLNKTRQIFWEQVDYYVSQPSVFQNSGSLSIGLSMALFFATAYVALFN